MIELKTIYSRWNFNIKDFVKSLYMTRDFFKERAFNTPKITNHCLTLESIDIDCWDGIEGDLDEYEDDFNTLGSVVDRLADRLIELDLLNKAYKDDLEEATYYEGLVDVFENMLKEVEEKFRVLGEGKETCPRCGDYLVVKHGSRGLFLGCPDFPKCTGAKDVNGKENKKGKSPTKDDEPIKAEGVTGAVYQYYCLDCNTYWYWDKTDHCPNAIVDGCDPAHLVAINNNNREYYKNLEKTIKEKGKNKEVKGADNVGLYGNPFAEEKPTAYKKPVVTTDLSQLTTTNKNNEGKKEGLGMNMNKIFGGEIGKVKDARFKLSLNGIAIKGNNGDYVVFDGTSVVNVTDFVVDADDIFFRMPVQTVEIGDLIIYRNEPLYVVEKGTGTISVLNALSDKVETIVPQKSMFGFQFFIKVVSLFNMGGGAPDLGGNAMLPLMLMGSKDGGSMSDMMLPMLMMGGLNGQAGDMNSMLPLMLMMGKDDKGGKSSMSDMLPLMLMSQGGFGQGAEGGINPMMFMMLGSGDGKMDSMAELMIMQSLFQGKSGVGLTGGSAVPEVPEIFEQVNAKKKGGRKTNAQKAEEAREAALRAEIEAKVREELAAEKK